MGDLFKSTIFSLFYEDKDTVTKYSKCNAKYDIYAQGTSSKTKIYVDVQIQEGIFL